MSSTTLHPSRLTQIASRFPALSVLVVGDIMLDEYLWGDATRISPEAPVPVVCVESMTLNPGGASNVAWNLAALGVRPTVVSVCGTDNNAQRLTRLLHERAIDGSGVLVLEGRKTTHKLRIVARNQQVVRADYETAKPLTRHEEHLLWRRVEERIDSVQGVILSDYGKGVLTPALIKRILRAASQRKLFVAVDPKSHRFSRYRGATIVTPNLKEAWEAAGNRTLCPRDAQILDIGKKLLLQGDFPTLLITLGEQGMALFERDRTDYFHLPTTARKVFDVTGAGDTVISVYTAATIAGAAPREAALLANGAAGITVGVPGSATVNSEQLREAFSR